MFMFRSKKFGLLSPKLAILMSKQKALMLNRIPLENVGLGRKAIIKQLKCLRGIGVIVILCLSVTMFSCTAQQRQDIGEKTQGVGTLTRTIGEGLQNPIVSGIGDLLILVGGLFAGNKLRKKLRRTDGGAPK